MSGTNTAVGAVLAGDDGHLSQTSVQWGSGGLAFALSHQSLAILG